jgi:hypothetical protein
MESSPPNMTSRRDLSGQRLVSWNALVQRLENVHCIPLKPSWEW